MLAFAHEEQKDIDHKKLNWKRLVIFQSFLLLSPNSTKSQKPQDIVPTNKYWYVL